jgi:heptosyltransferase II
LRRILVRATNWIGDAVMCLPALQALRANYPAAHIAILAQPWVADLYTRESFCDELIAYPSGRGLREIHAKRRLASALHHKNFDASLLLQNSFEAAAFVRAARIPVRIGYRRDGRGLLLTHALDLPAAGSIPPHQSFYYLELLRRYGLKVNLPAEPAIRLEASEQARSAGQAKLAALNIDTAPIGVSPGAAFGSAKRWTTSGFAQAATILARQRNTGIMLFGSGAESQLCEEAAALLKPAGVAVQNMAGRTSLREFIDLAAACQAFLTNDSGAMHIAVALGVPSVTIFGATDHIATGPSGPVARIVRESVECSPCHLRECPIDHRCMTRVSPERVVAAALEVLK